MTDKQVSTQDHGLAVDPAMTDLMRLAVDKGPDGVEALERIVALKERADARAAEAEFAAAFAMFKDDCPPIPKTASSKDTSGSGRKFSYNYAPLDVIAETIKPHLHKHGFAYSWDSKVEDGFVKAVCTLRHAGGHREDATFVAPIDKGGHMNATQQYATALTYASRYSLIQVLGLTTCDPDDDTGSSKAITEEQANEVERTLASMNANEHTRERFLGALGVQRIMDIPVRSYARAMDLLATAGKRT